MVAHLLHLVAHILESLYSAAPPQAKEIGTVYHVSDTDDKEQCLSMSFLLLHIADRHEDPVGELTVLKASGSAHGAQERHC